MPSPTTLPSPATREPLSLRHSLVLISLFFGTSITEAVSVNLIPLTLSFYTQDPLIIFWVLAINPAFGFIAQPLVGVLSDNYRTRLGRRATFLILSPPIVAACLFCLPYIETLALLIGVIVVLQFFQDVINGCNQPLIVDLVRSEQRTTMLGIVKASENLGIIIVLFLGMPLVEWYRTHYGLSYYGYPTYVIAACCQVVFVSCAAMFLREPKVPITQRNRLTLKRYLSDFINQQPLPRLAIVYFIRSFSRTAVVGSVALYALHTLRISEQEFGWIWGLMPFIALTTGIPIGLVVERYAKQRVLQTGFMILILGCQIGFWWSGHWGLLVAALVFGIGDMILEVTHKAFMSDYYPADLIGQLSGAINCFYAAGRVAGLISVGFVVKLTNPDVPLGPVEEFPYIDYSMIWWVTTCSSLLGILLLWPIRDIRHELKQSSLTAKKDLHASC